jgi:hypothetical protein
MVSDRVRTKGQDFDARRAFTKFKSIPDVQPTGLRVVISSWL